MTTSYTGKVRRHQSSSLAAYYPMNESTGDVLDYSKNGYNGTVVAVGQHDRRVYAPDGGPCAYFDGSASYVDIVAMAADLTVIGTAAIWFAMDNVQMKTATLRRILTIGANATTDVILLEHTATANTFRAAYIAGSTTKSVSPTIYNVGDAGVQWHHLAMTWTVAGSAVKVYVDGAQSSTTQTSPGTWSGSYASTLTTIGSANTTPDNPWLGWLSHCALWDVVLTDDEIRDLAKPR